MSATSWFHPAARAKDWPATVVKPSSVTTSSDGCAVTPAVEMVVEVVGTATAWVPVWSSGAIVAAPFHSLSWPLALMFAGLMVNLTVVMPPGLFG